ncbi:MAG TPA: alpha/beta hydrolase [Candidatus Scatavimonas merdigallinarum]|uniref:Alpha/beta hydrolase n=1 Tax=Candidatus Scatavimonas merdigallinarum TaxID=2840914 RepID=A0A9D1CUV0_9FIRM|nr:alpha/beta hydrolase [Candidatus Scatavimonas merdigallinarum]
MQNFKLFAIALAFLGAIAAGFFATIRYKRKTQMRFLDSLASQTISYFCRTSHMQNGGIIDLGQKSAMRPSKWKAPKGYTNHVFTISDVPAELLKNNASKGDKAVLQLHGGAYIVGFSDTYRSTALKLSKVSAGADVLSIDYRIAPEHVHPAALEDAENAWNWLLNNGYQPENIILVGDSAGGNLALSLTARLRDENRALPKALICMSPWADLSAQGPSFTYNLYKDPMFGRAKGAQSGSCLDNPEKLLAYAGQTDLQDKYLSPVYGDFHGFPPILLQVGTYELLESDSITIHDKASAAGVDVTLTRYPGMFHTFQLLEDLLPASRKAWQEIEYFLKKQFGCLLSC